MEQAFALVYLVPGIKYSDLDTMERRERVWFLKRLREQKEDEERAAKASHSAAISDAKRRRGGHK